MGNGGRSGETTGAAYRGDPSREQMRLGTPARQEAPCSIPPATAAALDAAQERRCEGQANHTGVRDRERRHTTDDESRPTIILAM